MKVLVIGGNGFIGSNLARALHARGDQVGVLDRFPARSDMDWSGIGYTVGDFHSATVLDALLPGVEQVYHVASCTVPSSADADPIADIQGNLVGTQLLLDGMRAKGVRRLCYFSSGGTVYGNPDTVPVPEDHPLRPISSYGIVKVAIEQYLGMFARQGWLDPVILRPSNPYGPGQATAGIQGAVAVFLGKALAGQGIQIWGDGEIIRDYIYIDDLVALAMAATDAEGNAVVNAGSGVGTSLNQLCERIRAVTGRPLPADYLSGRAFDVRSVVLDVSRSRHLYGWEARTGIEEGIRKTWNALLASQSIH